MSLKKGLATFWEHPETATSTTTTTNVIKSDPFWVVDPSILYSSDRLMDFIPTDTQTTVEKLNAIVRMSVYVTIILFFLTSNEEYLWVFIFTIVITYIYYSMTRGTNISEGMELAPITEKSKTLNNNPITELNQDYTNIKYNTEADLTKCTRPSADNPFMNFTMSDSMNIDTKGNITNRTQACNISNDTVKEEIRTSFNEGLYMDVNDLFEKHNSQREFYTMPSTTLYPDPEGQFANWLYNKPSTCKEDTTKCQIYEDIRVSSRPPLTRD